MVLLIGVSSIVTVEYFLLFIHENRQIPPPFFFLVSRQYSNLYSSYVPALFLRHFSEQNPRLHPQNLSIRQELQGIRTVNLPKALLQNLEFLEKSLYRFMGVVCRL